MKSVLVALLATLAFAASAPCAAHAFLDRAEPAVGSTVRATPPRLALWFTQDLEPAFSTVRVVDEDRLRQDRGDAAVDPRDRRKLEVTLPPLKPGRYRVEWRVLSVDTHVSEGDFTFVVAP